MNAPNWILTASSQLLLIGSLVGVLIVLLVVRHRKTAYPKRRWMPDIRRVV